MIDINKIHLLSKEMQNELDSQNETCPINTDQLPITEAVMPNGQRIKLLKIMQTSACERNCFYCAFRSGRNIKRASFTPDDLASTFMRIYQKKAVEGLFLSSGLIGGGIRTQDKLIDTADILRNKYHYRGYLHLKIMPGIEKGQLEQAMLLGSRISINLEAPNDDRLHALAPKKQFTRELIQPLKWADAIRKNRSPQRSWNKRWASSATQFVVGAVGETDLELITTSEFLFNQLHLSRIYYAGFNPVPDTPLENQQPSNPWRQHRLYQTSYLLRDYGYTLEEMPFQANGFLPLDIDPKLAWARVYLFANPIEINTADREQLIRIPGIGLKSASRILQFRQHRKIIDLKQLQKMGIIIKRSAEYILLNGKRPVHQLHLM